MRYYLILVLFGCALAQQQDKEFPGENSCPWFCQHCPIFRFNVDTMTCASCKQLDPIRKNTNKWRCPLFDHRPFCPFQRELDASNCGKSNCLQKPGCDLSTLSTCKTWCPRGYKVDTNGCPKCECQCPMDTKPINKMEKECKEACGGEKKFRLVNDETACLRCRCVDSQSPAPRVMPDCPAEPDCDCGSNKQLKRRDAKGCVQSCSCQCSQLDACPTMICSTGFKLDKFSCPKCQCDKEKLAKESWKPST